MHQAAFLPLTRPAFGTADLSNRGRGELFRSAEMLWRNEEIGFGLRISPLEKDRDCVADWTDLRFTYRIFGGRVQ